MPFDSVCVKRRNCVGAGFSLPEAFAIILAAHGVASGPVPGPSGGRGRGRTRPDPGGMYPRGPTASGQRGPQPPFATQRS